MEDILESILEVYLDISIRDCSSASVRQHYMRIIRVPCNISTHSPSGTYFGRFMKIGSGFIIYEIAVLPLAYLKKKFGNLLVDIHWGEQTECKAF